MDKPKLKIGFTVGVWDCWHQGHINVLRQAIKHCDYLVVGVMTDYWVRVQKGHSGRPRDSLALRCQNLRQSGLADRIVTLDTMDVTPYLQMVDVWIRGDEQKNMRPEAFLNVVFVRRTSGVSSTRKIQAS
jgi:glycerol-3-phosphate cytidylyltransferase